MTLLLRIMIRPILAQDKRKHMQQTIFSFGGSRPLHRVDSEKLMVNSLSFIQIGLKGVDLWQCLVWYRSKTVKKYEFIGHARM